jgi:hypothetical protein
MTTAVTASPHTLNFAHTTYNLPANGFAGMFVPNAGVIYIDLQYSMLHQFT